MSLLDQFRLDNQVAIVTGAGRGIGRAIARAFAEAGAKLVLAARTEADLHLLKDEIHKLGGQAIAVPCNVVKEEQLQALVDTAISHFGQINIVVNNAGGAFPNDPMKTSAETFNKDYNFNVTTAFNLCRLAMPYLQQAGNANIINITSAAARYSQKGFTSYGSAKAALTHLTRLMAADFAPAVRVNGIAPGTIMTDALEQFLNDEAKSKMIALTPMQALGQPEDIAAAAVYLASPAARWVTGKIIEVDGGAEATTWPF